MDRELPSPVMRFLRGETCVVVPSLVEEFVRTIRVVAPRKGGDRVDNLSKASLRLFRFFERPLQILSVLKMPGSDDKFIISRGTRTLFGPLRRFSTGRDIWYAGRLRRNHEFSAGNPHCPPQDLDLTNHLFEFFVVWRGAMLELLIIC